jgi:cytochrome P450
MLSRFHLSHDSIVVSDDGHAQFLRSIFLACVPSQERYPDIAKELVDEVFATGSDRELRLSSSLIPAVYLSMLSNLLGANVLKSLREHIRATDFQPGTRPMHLDGVMYALGMQFPSFGPMRKIIDLIFFKSDHYTRKITAKFEKMVFEFATPRAGSWYAHLIELKQSGKISAAQFRGELTSMLVSSYVLSAAMSSMLLCLAARPEYVEKIREDETLAKHFVNEVLRLFPPFRQFGYEEKGIWEKSGRSKEEVTDFMVSVFGLHRNENVWEDPDEFRPQRFAAANSTKGCKFMPFGLGKRSCTGRVYSIGVMVEVLKYACSKECNLQLTLPPDYVKDYVGLPLGINGRLVSFPVDDRIYARRELIDKGMAA